MVRKRIIFGSLCIGLLFAQLIALNACHANEDFQYNIRPRNPLEDEVIKPELIKPQANEIREEKHILLEASKENPVKYDCQAKYGIELYKDYGSPIACRRLYITDVLPNSPAQHAGLRIGDRILKINKQKIGGLSVEDVNYIMDRTQSMTLLIKDKHNKKRIVNLSRGRVCLAIKPPENEIFATYWNQLYDGDYDLEYISDKLTKMSSINLSYATKSEMQQIQNYVNYWIKKKKIFTNSYNSCKLSSDDDKAFCACLSKFVNRELAKIAKEEEYAHKRLELSAKLQMFAMAAAAANNVAGAINNHASALRNQHMTVNGNYNVQGNINLHHLRY